MGTPAITFDPSTIKPIAGASEVPPAVAPAQALHGAVSYASQQNPDQYAKLLRFQQLTGVPPVVSKGNEDQVRQTADANALDPHYLTSIAPNISAWASNHDNAAVSGVEEIHRMAGIEQNAAGMRASSPSWIDRSNAWIRQGVQTITGKTTDQLQADLYNFPLTRGGIDIAAGAAGMVGNVGSFFGIHGDGAAKKNLLQRIESSLSPEENTDPASLFHKSNEFDWLAKNVAPMLPAIIASGGTSAIASTLGVSPTAAKVLAGLSVGGMFTADQAGKTLTQVSEAGGSDYAARLAANRVAAINALPNALFGATDVVSFMRDNPLLTSLGMGGVTGASGQVSQNVVQGKPTFEGVPAAAIQGAAMQGGMHVGTEAFFGNLEQAVMAADQSKLRERSPEKFQEAMQAAFQGDSSLRIPADKFAEYFTAQGQKPSEVATSIGSTNYAEATLSGGDVEVPKADFLSKLDPDHQKALLPDIVDPASGLTARQHQEGRDELQQWVSGGGPEQMVSEAAQADTETASTPEFQQVKEDLRQRYIDAGETPEVSDTLAEKDANVYSNIAKSASLKPSELVAMYNPKVSVGEAPEGSLSQEGSAESPRGWFKVNSDGSYEIGRTKIGDFSTFAHESAHAYLHVLGDLATREGASETLQADHAKIMDWLGAKPGEELTTEQQEQWAKANEQYLREGKAPSTKLRGTFQRFGVWLQSVYKKASDLGVTLSDDIRGVLDRLYAAETGVDRAASDAGPAMFTNAEEAGWTEDQFKTYADAHDVSVEQAKEHILSKLNEARVRDSRESWLEEERNVREAVTSEIDRKPEYIAIRALRKGLLEDGTPVTMSKEELIKQFGEQRVKDLQKQHPGMYRSEGGLDPDTAAEMLGYSSAGEMVKAMEEAPRRSAAIAEITRTYMTAKHGDIRYDGTLEDQARLAVENDKRADLLHKELTALKKKLADVKGKAAEKKAALRDVSVAPIAAYREAASQMIEGKAPADLQPTRYLDASRKYSREGFDALRKGDAEEAANAKHKELLNHFLFREATKAKEFVGKFESYAKRMSSPGVQKSLGLAGSDYRDQFNKIMGRYGLGQNVQTQRSLSDWMQDQYNNQMKAPAIDESLLNEARQVDYRNAPIGELRLVQDALVNVRELAKQELGMTVGDRKIDFESSIDHMVQHAREKNTAKPVRVLTSNETKYEAAKRLLQGTDAAMTRMEFIMKTLDGGMTGPWHENLFNLAADSQGREYELQKDVTRRTTEALESMTSEERKSRMEKVTIEGIPETVTRKDLISWALNMGNEGNLDRLQKTFEAHGWPAEAIQNIPKMLMRGEWKFVQGMWDSLKPLGIAQSDLERRLTGLPPVMVKATPLHYELADGPIDLEGGYYPIQMDSRFSRQGAQQDTAQTAQNLMEAGYGRASTSRGAMKERTAYGGPLAMDYEQVLTQHIAKVTKDVSHREFMLSANKFLSDDRIRGTIRETLGQQYEEQMLPWLRTIVNDRNGSSVQGLSVPSQMIRGLRTNLVRAALTFKASTILLQLTHASSIFLHTSPKSYSSAMVDFLAKPREMSEIIASLSPNEMASRGDNLDRDMRKVLQDKEFGKKGIGTTLAKAGMIPVQYMDHLLSFPLWLSVYRDAQKEGLSDYASMHKADGAVRMGLGSNAPKDLPPVMRNNDFWKLVTTLGGFHNLKYNQIADVSRGFDGSLSGAAKLTYGLAMAAIIPALLGQWITGHGPKDDESDGLWAAKKALLFPVETIPLLGSVAEAVDRGQDASFSPLAGLADRATTVVKSVAANKDDQDWTGLGMSALQTAMEAAGIPATDQIFKTARYARKASQGEVSDPNVFDAIAGSAKK